MAAAPVGAPQVPVQEYIVVRCGTEEFKLRCDDLKKIPYLEALQSFSRLSTNENGQQTAEETETITFNSGGLNAKLMPVVLKYVASNRKRSLFTNLPDGTSTLELFKFMDFLLIEKPKADTQKWDTQLKNIRSSPVDKHGYGYNKANRSLARDTAVEICWTACDIIKSAKEENELFQWILFIVSHPRTFYYKIRTATLDWYRANYQTSEKQAALLKRWIDKGPPESRHHDPKSSSGGSDSSDDVDSLDWF